MIDWNRVASLKDEVGAEDFDEVVELFLIEVEDVTARLSQSVDLESLEKDMHFLKSSALTLGFRAFAENCSQAEWLCAGGKADDVNVTGVLNCFAESKTYFLKELPKQQVA